MDSMKHVYPKDRANSCRTLPLDRNGLRIKVGDHVLTPMNNEACVTRVELDGEIMLNFIDRVAAATDVAVCAAERLRKVS